MTIDHASLARREGLLKTQHPRTLPSHICISSIQVVIMKFTIKLYDQSRVTIIGIPAPMGQPSEARLATRVSMGKRYRRAPVSRTVKYPSSRKRRPPRRLTSNRDRVLQRPQHKERSTTCSTKPDRHENYGREQVLRSWWKAVLLRTAVKTDSFIREGLDVHEGLYCYVLPVWGYLVVGRFRRDDDLRTTSSTLSTNSHFFLSRRKCPFSQNRWPTNQARGKLSPDGVSTVRGLLKLDQREVACRPSTHVGRLFMFMCV